MIDPIKVDYSDRATLESLTKSLTEQDERILVIVNNVFRFKDKVVETDKKVTLRELYDWARVNRGPENNFFITRGLYRLIVQENSGYFSMLKRVLQAFYNGIVRREGFYSNASLASKLIRQIVLVDEIKVTYKSVIEDGIIEEYGIYQSVQFIRDLPRTGLIYIGDLEPINPRGNPFTVEYEPFEENLKKQGLNSQQISNIGVFMTQAFSEPVFKRYQKELTNLFEGEVYASSGIKYFHIKIIENNVYIKNMMMTPVVEPKPKLMLLGLTPLTTELIIPLHVLDVPMGRLDDFEKIDMKISYGRMIPIKKEYESEATREFVNKLALEELSQGIKD